MNVIIVERRLGTRKGKRLKRIGDKNMVNADNVEMPVKIGLGFYLRSNGSLWTGNRNNVIKLAERLARVETTKTRVLWHSAIWQGNSYFRISLCGQKQLP